MNPKNHFGVFFFFSGSPGSNSMDAVVAIVGVSWCLSALWGFVGVGG